MSTSRSNSNTANKGFFSSPGRSFVTGFMIRHMDPFKIEWLELIKYTRDNAMNLVYPSTWLNIAAATTGAWLALLLAAPHSAAEITYAGKSSDVAPTSKDATTTSNINHSTLFGAANNPNSDTFISRLEVDNSNKTDFSTTTMKFL
jgi:hypothetical protein